MKMQERETMRRGVGRRGGGRRGKEGRTRRLKEKGARGERMQGWGCEGEIARDEMEE
jgi:hypothetical protein